MSEQVSEDDAERRRLGQAVERVRAATERVRREAETLAAVLGHLDDDGMGPPDVLAAQHDQLLALETALADLRRSSDDEDRLRAEAR